MKNRTPVARAERPPLPDFAPVPRKYRHDGWTPERQRAFIEALADTGMVSRAAAMVNMTPEGAYYLRRQKDAESFRRAWEAALDYGVARMKDIAFERAIDGYLVPMFVGGRLFGWRRKYNDRLLMYCLRHYGEDASGKRTKIEYFSTRASAGAAASSPALAGEGDHPQEGGGASSTASLAEASTTTVRTIVTGKGDAGTMAANLDSSTAVIEDFEGVELDEAAHAEIYRVLQECAARRRSVAGTVEDERELFIAAEQPEREMLVYDPGYKHPRKERRRPPPAHDVVAAPEDMVEPHPQLLVEREDQFRSNDSEPSWDMLDDEEELARIEEAVAAVKAAKSTALPSPPEGASGSDHLGDGPLPGAGDSAKLSGERGCKRSDDRE